MTSDNKIPSAAFLLPAVASAIAGLILLDPQIVPGDMVTTMTNMANNVVQMRVSIVLLMITAIGVAILGVLLFVVLRRQTRSWLW